MQRGRHQVKAVEPQPRAAQKRRVPGALRRLQKLALAVLVAALQLALVGLQDRGDVLQLARERPGLLPRERAHVLRRQPRLPDDLHPLPRRTADKAPARLRAAVERELALQALHRPGEQHRPAPLVHALARGPPRGVEDQAAQPLRADHAQAKRALQRKPVQKRQLGLQRELPGHHHRQRVLALPHRLPQPAEQLAAQQVVAARYDAQHAYFAPSRPAAPFLWLRTIHQITSATTAITHSTSMTLEYWSK